MSRVETYDDKFLWHRAVCDECGWKSPTAHADPAAAEKDAAEHDRTHADFLIAPTGTEAALREEAAQPKLPRLAELIVDAVVPSAAIPLPSYDDQVAAVEAILRRELTGTPLAPRS